MHGREACDRRLLARLGCEALFDSGVEFPEFRRDLPFNAG